MDQIHQGSSPVVREDAVTFSEADYSEHPEKVIAHAAATGRAVVVGADGKPRIIITIPIVDLPTLEY
jgi:hypothetical protein